MTNAMASMYGSNLGLQGQMYGADTSRANALTAADVQRYGYDANLFGNLYNTDAGMINNANNNATQRYGYDTNLFGNMYNTNAGMINNANNNATQMYGYDTKLYGNMYNANASMYNNNNNNATQRYTSDQNFYTNNRNLDLSQMRLGSDMLNSGVNGAAGAGQGVYNVGNTLLNAPLQSMQSYNNIMQPVLNTTGTGNTTVQGSQIAGGLGGAIAGNQLAGMFSNNLGLGSSSYAPNYMGSSLSYPSSAGYGYTVPW